MIVSTCKDRGHEFTTAEFIHKCPRCGAPMQVEMIIEPTKLDRATKLLIAEQKLIADLETAFCEQATILNNYENKAPAEIVTMWQAADRRYMEILARLKAVQSELIKADNVDDLLNELVGAA